MKRRASTCVRVYVGACVRAHARAARGLQQRAHVRRGGAPERPCAQAPAAAPRQTPLRRPPTPPAAGPPADACAPSCSALPSNTPSNAAPPHRVRFEPGCRRHRQPVPLRLTLHPLPLPPTYNLAAPPHRVRLKPGCRRHRQPVPLQLFQRDGPQPPDCRDRRVPQPGARRRQEGHTPEHRGDGVGAWGCVTVCVCVP